MQVLLSLGDGPGNIVIAPNDPALNGDTAAKEIFEIRDSAIKKNCNWMKRVRLLYKLL